MEILAFPVWESGKDEIMRRCWMMYRVLSGRVNNRRKQRRVQKTHHWDPNHPRFIGVLLPVQSSGAWIWTPVVPP
jgi:hypothetical protein